MRLARHLLDDLRRDLKDAAKERGTSQAELIRTAIRHELLGAPAGQAERAVKRAGRRPATSRLPPPGARGVAAKP